MTRADGTKVASAATRRAIPRFLNGGLGRSQSWVHNCEVANRRVDVAEFAAWAVACGVEPADALERFLAAGGGKGDAKRSSRGRRPKPP